MASTSGREEDEDALLDIMANAMISHLKGKVAGKKASGTGGKQARKESADGGAVDAGFLSIKDGE
jgi:hypothetical protein